MRAADRPQVFISYSRRDREFALTLCDGLLAGGKRPWLDLEGVSGGQVFGDVLRTAIEETDGFVFIISPDSARSTFCAQEIQHALALGKRIVPVVHRPVPDADLPAGIRERHWVPDGADLAARVIAALDADHEHVRRHTQLLGRALEWEAAGRSRELVATGDDLQAAERWLADAQQRDPAPTPLHAAWVAAGRDAASRRQRRLTIAISAVAVLAATLSVLALLARSDAVDAEQTASSRALAGRSQAQLDNDPQLAVLLAREALRKAPTEDAMLAAQRAIDATTARALLRPAGAGGCADSGRLVLLDRGRRAAVSSCSGSVVLYDLSRGDVVRRLRVGPSAGALAVSPSERSLAVGVRNAVVLVDARTGRVRTKVRVPVTPVSLSYDERGRRMAVGSSGGVGVLDLRTRRFSLLERAGARLFYGLAFGAGDDLLITAEGVGPDAPSGLLIAQGAGRPARRLGPAAEQGVLRLARTVAVDPRRRAAYVGVLDQPTVGGDLLVSRVQRINIRTGRLVWERVAPTPFAASSIDVRDGRVAVGFNDGLSEVLDARSGALVVRHAGNTTSVTGIGLAATAGRVVTASSDGVVRTWASAGSERLRVQLPPARSTSAAFLRGDRLTVYGQDTVELDARTGRVVRRDRDVLADGQSVGISDDGRWLGVLEPGAGGRATYRVRRVEDPVAAATPVPVAPAVRSLGVGAGGLVALTELAADGGAGIVRVIDPRRPARRRSLESFPAACRGGFAMAASADGRRFAVTDPCGALTVHDLRTGRRLRTVRLPMRLTKTVLSRDGARAYVAGSSGQVGVIDTATGDTQVLREQQDVVTQLALSGDGRWLSAGDAGGVVSTRDAASLRLVRQHRLGRAVQHAGFSDDDESLVVLDEDRVVRVWDVCARCRSAARLADRLDDVAVRRLTASERRTFRVEARS